MPNEGKINYLLGMQILCNQSKGWLFVSQENNSQMYYINSTWSTTILLTLLSKVDLKLSHKNCHDTPKDKMQMSEVPYSQLFESLMHAIVYIKPNYAFTMGSLAIYLVNPSKLHWQLANASCQMYSKIPQKHFLSWD